MSGVDVNIRINLKGAEAERAVDKLKVKMGFLEKQVNGASRAFSSFIGNIAAQAAFRVLGSVTGAMRDAITTTLDYETALVGLGKTTNTEGVELQKIGKQFRELSKRIPETTIELLKLGKTAAQLGIPQKDIVKFTETMVRLASATDIVGEQGSIDMARFLNATGTAREDVDKFASAIVDLGNTFELKEAGLLSTATSVAQSTAQFNVSATDVLALSTAFQSFGIQAELAGTNTGVVFKEMTKAVSTGGKQLAAFAEGANVSSEEFKEAFEKGPVEALKLFVKGLSESKKASGDSATEILRFEKITANAGLTNQRVGRIINSLVTRYDKYTQAQKQASVAVEENTKLTEESDRAFDTASSKAKLLGNAIVALTTTALVPFLPILSKVITELTDFVNAQSELIEKSEKVGTKLKDLNTGFSDLKSSIGADGVKAMSDAFFDVDSKIARVNKSLSTLKAFYDDDNPKVIAAEEHKNSLLLERIALQKAVNQLRFTEAENNKPEDGGEAEVDKAANVNAKKIELLDIFNDITLTKQQETELSFTETAQLFQSARFKAISTGLGLEEAAKTAAKVKELVALGKHEKAKQLLVDQTRKANAKIKEKEERDELDKVARKKSALNTIASLQHSHNKTLAAAGKAFAIAQAIQNGYLAVSNAYKDFPYPFNIGVAALVAAATAQQVAGITGNNFENGGVVGGSSFTGDNVQANVNSGEMILNRQQQSQLFAQANGASNNQQQKQEIVVHTTVELDGQAVGKSVSRQVADGLVLGENV